MVRKIIFWIVMLFLSLPAFPYTGSTKDFIRLEAVGEFPDPLLKIMNKTSDNGQDKLIIQANAEIRLLLREGKIIYGDPITHYLETLLDQLLKDDLELRSRIHIYTMKSSVVNAVMYPNGLMFVNVGLIAQSTNEAELAFVISHELIHFMKQHGMGKREKLKDMESFLKYHARSREMEVEADRLGFELYYKKSGYNFSAIEGVFDMLQYAYLPFDEIKINRAYFEKEFYRMDSSYFLTSVTPISSRENSVDTFSTHPNIKNRRIEIGKLIQKNADISDRLFLNGEERYHEIRTLARFETINQQLIENNFLKSFYNVYTMRKEEADHKFFLDIAEIASLYGIYKLKIGNEYAEYMPKKEDIEGEFQFVVNFFQKVKMKELAMLCLRNIWEIKKQNPENTYLSLLFDDIIFDMVNELNLKTLVMFSDYGINEQEDINEEELTSSEKENKSKYGKIKEKKRTGHQTGFKTENYMLVDLKQDAQFVEAFETALIKIEKKSAGLFIKSLSRSDKNKLKGNKEFLVFRPRAYEYTDRIKRIEKTRKTKKHTKRLEKRVQQMAKKNHIQTNIISNITDNFLPKSIKDYQTYVRLNDFYRSLNRFSEITYESRDIGELAEGIGFQYIHFIVYDQYQQEGIKNVRYKLVYGISSVLQYPFLPVGIYQFIPKEYIGDLFFRVYDMKNSTFIYKNRRSFSHENSSNFIQQALYEEFYKTYVNIVK